MSSSKSVKPKSAKLTSAEVNEKLDDRSQRIVAVRVLMKQREDARKGNDFGKSDQIRDKLSEKYGVIVKDQVGGPSGWKFTDGSTRKLATGAEIPEEAKKKRTREEDSKTAPGSGSKKQKQNDRARDEAGNNKKAKANAKSAIGAPETQKNKKVLEGILGPSGPGIRTIQGVLIEDIKIGDGKFAESGKRCKMGYVGKLKSNGKMFDASGNKPFTFRLGRSEVIRGWDIGVNGMKEGGKRRLTIPPEKAYGKAGAPPTIPGQATLVFDITLVEVK